MTTKVKLDGTASTTDSLTIHAERLWENPGAKLMAIAELAVTRREEPGPDVEKDRIVKLRIVSAEVAVGDQEHILRSGIQALHLHRTAGGTLTEDGDVQHAKDTLEKLDKHLDSSEAARLVTAYDWLIDRVAGVSRKHGLDTADLRRELKKIVAIGEKAKNEQLKLNDKTIVDAEFTAAAARLAEEEAAELAAQTEKLRGEQSDDVDDQGDTTQDGDDQ